LALFLFLRGSGSPLFATPPSPRNPIDRHSIRVAAFYDREIRTMRVQAWNDEVSVVLHPLPNEDGSGPLYSQETRINLPEGEDITLELTNRGITAFTSMGESYRAGFSRVDFKAENLMCFEPPNRAPFLFSDRMEVTIRDHSLYFVNITTIRNFLVSAVSEECPSSEPEAIKAQIIVDRTFLASALYKPPHASEPFDICDTHHCLLSMGKAKDRELVDLLIDQVKEEVMTSKGQVFHPYFQHTCAGRISSAKDVFEVDDGVHLPKEDRLDGTGPETCFHSPSFSWMREFQHTEIVDFLSIMFAAAAEKIFTTWEPAKVDSAGRLLRIRLLGNREKYVSGIEFLDGLQEMFGMNSVKSTRITTQKMRRTLIISGLGQGYGVGLCMMGADGMARKGQNYRQILEFYYSGIAIHPWGAAPASQAPGTPAPRRNP